MNCGAGLSNEECASQVALTNYRLRNDGKLVIHDEHPFEELGKITPEAFLLKPADGVSIRQIDKYNEKMYGAHAAIYTTHATKGMYPGFESEPD